jgi:hypothetical protein
MKKKTGSDESESWVRAQTRAEAFGVIPATFSVPIRTLIGDAERDVRVGDASRFLLDRLLKSPSFRSPYYGAIRLNFPENLETSSGYVNRRALIDACEPFTHAVITALIYAFRRTRSLCPEEELRFILPPLQESGQVGAYVGRCIQTVGFGRAVLLSVYRYLGLALLVRDASKEFKEYRRLLKDADRSFDSSYELSVWGCTSAQVGALVLQTFGFGVDTVDAIRRGSETERATFLRDDPKALAAHVAHRWIESFKFTGEPPEIPIGERAVMPIDLRPPQPRVEQLTTRVRNIPELGEAIRWLELGKEDADIAYVPAEPGPDGAAESEHPDEEFVEIPVYEELPAEMRAAFSKKDFEEVAVKVAELLGEED